MVVLDAAMSLALLSLLAPGEAGLSIQLAVSQPQGAMLGAKLGVSATVVRLGTTLVFATAEVKDADGETVAFGEGSFLRREFR